jgi:plasmid maintenance system antidote protein VapI
MASYAPYGILLFSSISKAKDIGVPAPRMYDVVAGKRGISADTALRLARYFGTSAQY